LLILIEVLAIVIGVFFMFVSSLGVLRLPDFYSRLHAPTKAATLGLFFLFVAVAIGVPEKVVVTKALLALIFIAATAPVGAHIMSRAAYRTGVRPDERMVIDEYQAVVALRKEIDLRKGPSVESSDVQVAGELPQTTR
jgi:multicomponent Na+:H+ antiporter subunit G